MRTAHCAMHPKKQYKTKKQQAVQPTHVCPTGTRTRGSVRGWACTHRRPTAPNSVGSSWWHPLRGCAPSGRGWPSFRFLPVVALCSRYGCPTKWPETRKENEDLNQCLTLPCEWVCGMLFRMGKNDAHTNQSLNHFVVEAGNREHYSVLRASDRVESGAATFQSRHQTEQGRLGGWSERAERGMWAAYHDVRLLARLTRPPFSEPNRFRRVES